MVPSLSFSTVYKLYTYHFLLLFLFLLLNSHIWRVAGNIFRPLVENNTHPSVPRDPLMKIYFYRQACPQPSKYSQDCQVESLFKLDVLSWKVVLIPRVEMVMLLRHSTNILPGTTSGQAGRADPAKTNFVVFRIWLWNCLLTLSVVSVLLSETFHKQICQAHMSRDPSHLCVCSFPSFPGRGVMVNRLQVRLRSGGGFLWFLKKKKKDINICISWTNLRTDWENLRKIYEDLLRPWRWRVTMFRIMYATESFLIILSRGNFRIII